MISKFLGLKLPMFMPDATLGAVKTLNSQQVEETGTNMLVVNTFHLLTKIGIDGMKRLGGIKSFMNWKGKVISDSGGFQVFSLIHEKKKMGKVTNDGAVFKSPVDGSEHKLTPEISVDMQVAIGSDVIIMLDDCRSEDVDVKNAEKSVLNTIKWAKRSKEHILSKYPELSKRIKIFAVVQGGSHKELREKCTDELIKIGFDGYCFGGWPIDSDKRLVSDILKYTASLLPDDKPKYAMGVGTPDNIKKCYKMGYNMFDCVLPTRNARHGFLYTRKGVIRIKNARYKYDLKPIDSKCGCLACQKYSRGYLHHLFRSGEILCQSLATIHNLTYYSDLMKSLQDK